MSGMWCWTPGGTSNGMYGNFPNFRRTSSGVSIVNSTPNGHLTGASPPFACQHGAYQQQETTPNTNTTAAETEQKPCPEVNIGNACAVEQNVPAQAANVEHEQQQHYQYQPQPEKNNQETSEEPTVQYLRGEEAEAVLRQIANCEYLQNQQQATSAQNAANTDAAYSVNNNPAVYNNYYQYGSGSGSGDGSALMGNYGHGQTQGQTQAAASPVAGMSQAVPETYLTGNQFFMPQPQAAGIPAPQSNSETPAGDTPQKATKPRSKLQSNIKFVRQHSYEGPPSIQPSAVAMQIPSQGKATISQSKRMSGKPSFHLCGQCIKCKAIQSNPGIPNSVTFKPNITAARVSPMGRQVSTTVFPR